MAIVVDFVHFGEINTKMECIDFMNNGGEGKPG
jgi:hypothetical protein